jgi:hypothetical protein
MSALEIAVNVASWLIPATSRFGRQESAKWHPCPWDYRVMSRGRPGPRSWHLHLFKAAICLNRGSPRRGAGMRLEYKCQVAPPLPIPSEFEIYWPHAVGACALGRMRKAPSICPTVSTLSGRHQRQQRVEAALSPTTAGDHY